MNRSNDLNGFVVSLPFGFCPANARQAVIDFFGIRHMHEGVNHLARIADIMLRDAAPVVFTTVHRDDLKLRIPDHRCLSVSDLLRLVQKDDAPPISDLPLPEHDNEWVSPPRIETPSNEATAESMPFWLVWSPQGNKAPSYRHPSQDSAEREAERLAMAHMGKTFFVLQPRFCAVDRGLDRKWMNYSDDDQVPF